MKARKKECGFDVRTIENPVYGTSIQVCWGDREAFRGFIKDRGWDISDAPAATYERNGCFVMWFEPAKNENALRGFIAHECFHYAAGTARRAGIVLTSESEEAFAYLVSFAVENVTQVLFKPYRKNGAK